MDQLPNCTPHSNEYEAINHGTSELDPKHTIVEKSGNVVVGDSRIEIAGSLDAGHFLLDGEYAIGF